MPIRTRNSVELSGCRMERSNDMVEDLLPEDIVFQILLWLPVVSLLRFKSVCKSWCSLIESCRFVSQHKDKGSEESNNNVIVKDKTSYPLFSLLYGNTQFELSENLDYQYLEQKENNRYIADIISCDGIIFMTRKYWDITLWNPATRQFRILPESQVPLPQRGGHYTFHGFGFNEITNDYKVVRLFFFREAFQSVNNYNQVEVYSLNTDSWKSLDYVLPIDTICSDLRSPYLNGIYCWLGRFALYNVPENGNDNEMFRIITFDFTSEVFGTIPLPNIQIDNTPSLSILRDKITFIYSAKCASGLDMYQIWVLNEYGVKESWTKLCAVGPFLLFQSIGFSKNGDLFLRNYEQQLCLCNLVTNELKNLPLVGGSNLARFQVAVYKESLVSVQREKRVANVVT